MRLFVFFLTFITLSVSFVLPSVAKDRETTYERVMRTGVIRCAYATWPPYIMKDPNTGALSGLSYDYVMEMGRTLDLKIEWTEEAGWGNYVEGLNSNRYDLMCVSDWAVGERLKVASVTNPVLYSALFAYVRADDMRFDGDLSTLNKEGVKIAAIDGDTSYDVSRLNFPGAELHMISQNSDGAQLLLEVATGKADAVIVDDNIARDFLENNPGSVRKVSGVGPVQVFPEVFVFRQGEWRLKALLDSAILLINNTAFSRGIVEKYGVEQHFPVKTFEK